jgi:hypothetical protein
MSRPARTPRVLAVGIPVALVTALSSLGVLLPAGPAGAASAAAQRKVVVVLVDRLSAAGMAAVSGAQQLDALGASGLMITSTGPGSQGDSQYAAVTSLSAGAPAVAPVDQPQPRQTSAVTAPALGPLVVPGMDALREANASAAVSAVPGLLGQALGAHGVKTAAIGDSDMPGHPYRPGPFIAMNAGGVIPYGSIGSTDQTAQGSVLPAQTNLLTLEDTTTAALSVARFVVVDWGDTARLDALEERDAARLGTIDATGRTLGGRLDAEGAASLARLSTYLGFLQKELDLKHDVIVLMSANAPRADERGGLELAPISIAGGPAPHGSLTSRSTHQTGLVSNQDFAPTVLGWFGVPTPSQMRGHFITGRETGLGLTGALTDERGIRRVLRQREIVLLAAALLWLAAVALCLWMVERRLRRVGARAKVRQAHADDAIKAEWLPRWLVFAASLLPLALLLQPLVGNGSTWVVLLEVLAVVLFFGWLLSLVSKRRAAAGLGAVGILTVLAIAGDRATGGWLSSRTLTGPNIRVAVAVAMGPMQIGACVAAAILAAGAMIRGARSRPGLRWVWLGLMALVLILLALPFMGGVTAAAAAGLTGLAVLGALALRQPPSRRVWELAGVALGAALLVLGLVHLVGRASFAHSVATADGSSKAALPLAVAVAAHGVSGWALLLFVSQWTVIILASLAAVAYAETRFDRGPWAEGPTARLLQPPDRYVRATMAGLGAAAVVALLTSVVGAPAAGVLLMGCALIASAGALERSRPVPR